MTPRLYRAETAVTQRKLSERVERVLRRKDELVEAFVHRKVLDRATFEDRVRREDEALTLARREQSQAQLDEVDVEDLLNFAEILLTNTAQVWLDLDLGQKLRFQSTLFPEGLIFDGESFRTAVTSPVLTYLREISTEKVSVASPTGRQGRDHEDQRPDQNLSNHLQPPWMEQVGLDPRGQ